MRTILFPMLLPFAAWFSALQAVSTSLASLESSARLAGIAGVLGTFTVLIYRLGVWRSEMEHTKHVVGEAVNGHREESAANFERLDQRLAAIDYVLSVVADRQQRTGRWQTRTDRRLERLEEPEEAS